MGAIKPFAAGGVIGDAELIFRSRRAARASPAKPGRKRSCRWRAAPTAGSASRERRRGGGNVTINIATPDADSFRRSETYLTGQIARAVARGQRSL